PVYASMNSYVYDQQTDELLYILDANNMASSYRYDDAGRLKAVYKEVEDAQGLTGGFKLLSQYRYNYQNTGASVSYNEDINNCIEQSYPKLQVRGVNRICIPDYNPYDIFYRVDAFGGSGYYKYEWQWL